MDNLNLNQKVIDSHSKNQKECLFELQKKTNFFNIHIFKNKPNHFKKNKYIKKYSKINIIFIKDIMIL